VSLNQFYVNTVAKKYRTEPLPSPPRPLENMEAVLRHTDFRVSNNKFHT
jgi:hypothetical protein